MKLLSWNINGIRAADRKGLFDWFKKESPDILCLQEISGPRVSFEVASSVKRRVTWSNFMNRMYIINILAHSR